MAMVLPFYERFIRRFPNVSALAAANEGEVLKAWEGFGYYTRARNLHRAAQIVCDQHGGVFPCEYHAVRALPGIGDYTAGAILSIAFGQPVPAVDANVLRVFARLDHIEGIITSPPNKRRVTGAVGELLKKGSPRVLTQAIMELGALVCLSGIPRCDSCPVADMCAARESGCPHTLPQLPARKEKEIIHRIVLVVRCKEHVLVRKRTTGLLKGMWDFLSDEHMHHVKGYHLTILGESRHVFTHRVWEMSGYQTETDQMVCVPGCVWVDRETFERLPFPAALKQYTKHINSPIVIP
jgi:A/G-specific adenine glycosylase